MEPDADIFIITVIAILGIAAFLAFWSGIIKLISIFGGWGKLSKNYKFIQYNQKPILSKSFQSAQIGFSNYNGVLTFSYYPEGLGMEVMIFFRVGHPKLFIPWKDIKLKEKGKSIFVWNSLEIGNPPIAILSVNNKVLETINTFMETKSVDVDRW